MRNTVLLWSAGLLLVLAGYFTGQGTSVAHADTLIRATVPKSYGRLAAVIADSIGTGLIFEDAEGIIRFVSVTGMKEGELKRY